MKNALSSTKTQQELYKWKQCKQFSPYLIVDFDMGYSWISHFSCAKECLTQWTTNNEWLIQIRLHGSPRLVCIGTWQLFVVFVGTRQVVCDNYEILRIPIGNSVSCFVSQSMQNNRDTRLVLSKEQLFIISIVFLLRESMTAPYRKVNYARIFQKYSLIVALLLLAPLTMITLGLIVFTTYNGRIDSIRE